MKVLNDGVVFMLARVFLGINVLIFWANFCFSQVVSVSQEEFALYEMINAYRVQNGLYEIPLSKALTQTAQAHAKDLHTNRPFNANNCNFHSWSNKGSWSSCCYDENNPTINCMTQKPREISRYYQGEGYELVHGDTHGMYQHYEATPKNALDTWKNNSAFNSMLLNKGFIWRSKNWRAIGVGIYKDFAVVWFGTDPDPNTPQTPSRTVVQNAPNTPVQQNPPTYPQPSQPSQLPQPQPTQPPPTKTTSSPNTSSTPVVSRVKPRRTPRQNGAIALRLAYGWNYNMGNFSSNKDVSAARNVSCMIAYDTQADLFDMFGVQVSYSRNKGIATERYITAQPTLARQGLAYEDSLSHNLEIEAGFISKGLFNLKGGIGWFNYRNRWGERNTVSYYLLSPSLDIGFRNLKFNTGVSFLFGKDFEKVIVRPTLNIALQFIIVGSQNHNGRKLFY